MRKLIWGFLLLVVVWILILLPFLPQIVNLQNEKTVEEYQQIRQFVKDNENDWTEQKSLEFLSRMGLKGGTRGKPGWIKTFLDLLIKKQNQLNTQITKISKLEKENLDLLNLSIATTEETIQLEKEKRDLDYRISIIQHELDVLEDQLEKVEKTEGIEKTAEVSESVSVKNPNSPWIGIGIGGGFVLILLIAIVFACKKNRQINL